MDYDDWHNDPRMVAERERYEPRKSENSPGEWGQSVVVHKDLISDAERSKYNDGWKQHAFNAYVSDLISVRRRLPDIRDAECQADLSAYELAVVKQLPTVSVIICFHNEEFSVLLRTVYSVLERSPFRLIEQIILVDDASEFGTLMSSSLPFCKHSDSVPFCIFR